MRSYHVYPAILVVAIVIGLLWLLLFKNGKQPQPKMPPDWMAAYTEQQKDVAKWKGRAEKAYDSITGLHTEIGFLTVELNRSESKAETHSTNYKAGKRAKDTTAMLNNCDSLVEELNIRYFKTRADRDLLIDSLNIFYGHLIDYKDSALDACDSTNNIAVTAATHAELQRDDAIQETAHVKKKSKLGWIAAALATVVALGLSIFK